MLILRSIGALVKILFALVGQLKDAFEKGSLGRDGIVRKILAHDENESIGSC